MIQLLVELKLFIFFNHVAMSDNDVETINIICKSFRLKLFKNLNSQFDVIFRVKIAFVVNDVKIVDQVVYININSWFVNIKIMYDDFIN